MNKLPRWSKFLNHLSFKYRFPTVFFHLLQLLVLINLMRLCIFVCEKEQGSSLAFLLIGLYSSVLNTSRYVLQFLISSSQLLWVRVCSVLIWHCPCLQLILWKTIHFFSSIYSLRIPETPVERLNNKSFYSNITISTSVWQGQRHFNAVINEVWSGKFKPTLLP